MGHGCRGLAAPALALLVQQLSGHTSTHARAQTPAPADMANSYQPASHPHSAPSTPADAAPLCIAGKSEKITITNDKGRLSQEEIDRMVQEGEEFAEADKKVKGRVDARNALETYVFNMRSTMDDKLGDKLSADDKDTVRPGPRCLKAGQRRDCSWAHAGLQL